MKDEKKAPKLRFKGFTDDWEQVKFGKITSKYKTRNKDGEQLRSFSVSNIYGFIPQEEQFENGGIALNADKKNSIIVTPNSFAYNPARINVGSIGYYNGNENVLVSSLYEVFKLHKEYDPNYLWFWLKSNHFNWWIHRLQEGSVRSYFYYDKFSEIKERMPSLPEQMKIGQLLKSLDHTITLHEEKHRQLEQLKKALLQKMFADETGYPVLRFKGFTEKWEQVELGQLGIISRGLTYRPNDVTDKNGVRVLRSSNIYEDSFVLNDNDVFVNSSVVNVPNLKNGDILVTSANGSSRLVGKHAIIKGLSNKTVHGGFMLAIRPATNSYFLNSLMSTSWYDNFISTFVSGGNGSIGNLKKSDLERQSIFSPLNKEQNKIGQLFQSLDKTIILHDKKIQYLKQLKRGLLQKMFI